jgi:hypothetical protein
VRPDYEQRADDGYSRELPNWRIGRPDHAVLKLSRASH